MAGPDFWNDNEAAQKTQQQRAHLQRSVNLWKDLAKANDDLEAMLALLAEEADESLLGECGTSLSALEKKLTEAELKAMLSGESDGNNAILAINSGAGGTESQDWAQMLMRMYTRWSERRGYDVAVLDVVPGEEAGIKSVSMEIQGDYAYGYLKAEKGVHRLVRISPFDAQARRHTSFASVFVYPVVDDSIDIDLRDEDIELEVFRASGAGGQHVNKTSSAVRLRHVPTGTVVTCQQERSQFKNRATAMKMLKAKLYQRARDEQEKEKAKVEATKADIAWGNQSRSYVFQPYTMVNDHRTELNVRDSDATVVFSFGPPTGGSALTAKLARSLGKSLLTLDLEVSDTDQAVARLRSWLAEARPRVLNVAGPRLSQEPRIAEATAMILRKAIPAVSRGDEEGEK